MDPMIHGQILKEFEAAAEAAREKEELRQALIKAKLDMGFDYVVLSHHANHFDGPQKLIRFYDYPEPWMRQFEHRRLGRIDPVHRACHVESYGFPWTAIDSMIPMRASDWEIFAEAREHGIGHGYTIPIHVPGETSGSVSFVMRTGSELPTDMLMIAQLIAGQAFRSARRIWEMRPRPRKSPLITPAQQECMRWMMLGKTDWVSSRIRGCHEQTVKRHIKQACERYDVDSRTYLMTLALRDGTLSLADV